MSQIFEIKTTQIKPNPWQPRKSFDPQDLEELAASIKTYGIIQPLVVSKIREDEYELIAGQRRLEAAKILGLKEVSVIIRESKEQGKLEIALIENLQRKDLNPLEKAKAYQKLQEEFNLSQEEIAKRIGKARATIANTLRLLDLPEEIKKALIEGRINEGQAKIILSLKNSEDQLNFFKKILQTGISVREAEKKARKFPWLKFSEPKINLKENRSLYNENEARLREALSTKVKIKKHGERGEILIEFYSEEELGEIVRKVVSG